MKDAIRSQIPVGSLRPKVEAFMQAQGLEEADFDYPTSDPGRGTLIEGVTVAHGLVYKVEKICSWLRMPRVYVVFCFDHNGLDGKLTSYQVSGTSIPIPPP